jgi:2'-5' RNA ligase
MTVQYAIVVFPVLDAATDLESFRRRFDPLASMIPAHITLVFPFTDLVSEADLRKHVASAIADQRAFHVALSEITVKDDGYVFLNVEAGVDVLGALHDRLYSGLLSSHLSSAHEYRPHITIARLPDLEQARSAAAEARLRLAPPLRGTINSVALFRLNEPGRGDVAWTVDLIPDSARPAPNVR